MEQINLTEHTSETGSPKALLFEREKHLKGATFHVMGRKEAERYKGTVIKIRRIERIHVV